MSAAPLTNDFAIVLGFIPPINPAAIPSMRNTVAISSINHPALNTPKIITAKDTKNNAITPILLAVSSGASPSSKTSSPLISTPYIILAVGFSLIFFAYRRIYQQVNTSITPYHMSLYPRPE